MVDVPIQLKALGCFLGIIREMVFSKGVLSHVTLIDASHG